MLPDQFGVLNIKNVLSASLLVSLISFIAELFLHDVNLPLLIYVWGRNFLPVVQQQWAYLMNKVILCDTIMDCSGF